MAQKKLRWGILSTALINQALIPAIRNSHRSALAAVASRDAARAESYAKEWGIPKAHSGYEALVNDPEIDVIFNPLPNSLHGEWTARAADAGKHVLCEKPLAISEEECRGMIAAAERNRVVIMEAFMYRYHPQMQMVRDWIDKGEIGELERILASFTFTLSRPGNPRWDPNMGGGALWDVGCYPVNFSRFVVGQEPEEVFAWQKLAPSGVDLSLWGTLRFPSPDGVGTSGLVAQIDCGFDAPLRKKAEVVGKKGTIYLDDPWHASPTTNIFLKKEGEKKSIPVPEGDSYFLEVEALCDAVLEGKPPLVSLEDSLGNTRTVLALYQSARTGKAVQLGKR